MLIVFVLMIMDININSRIGHKTYIGIGLGSLFKKALSTLELLSLKLCFSGKPKVGSSIK